MIGHGDTISTAESAKPSRPPRMGRRTSVKRSTFMKIDHTVAPLDLAPAIHQMWDISAIKIDSIDRSFDRSKGVPVHTVAGRYQPRGWTDWTQGFEFGSAILQFDATGEERFLEMAIQRIRVEMPTHITNFGVHDHGFNQVSTYGNLLRLGREGRISLSPWQQDYIDLALRCSGSVQAHRWTNLEASEGYIHTFVGSHSLFVDTMRSLRVLVLAHQLGHVMKDEGDEIVSLLGRALAHARTTARYNILVSSRCWSLSRVGALMSSRPSAARRRRWP